jgi:large repetitive protein
VATRVGLRRLLPISLIAILAALAITAGAGGGIGDAECPNAAGENTNTCPVGQVGVPYSLTFRLPDGVGCAPGDDTWHQISGTLPPGLALATDGTLAGTPTQAGVYKFWVEMRLPDYPPSGDPPSGGCNGSKDTTQREFTLEIRPGVPRLVIGPESVAPATVGTPYTAAMTATVSDAKTWSIVVGMLPPGLNLGASDGVISGLPGAPGSFSFTVRAVIADGRSDTKALTIEVRDRLRIAGSGDLEARVVRTEVGVAFDASLLATGGFGTYVWSIDGVLPRGLTFGEDGTVSGAPEEPGTYRFTVIVSDAEGRRAAYAARVVVAKRLTIVGTVLKPGKVRHFLSRKVVTSGGVGPISTRLRQGPLPRGVSFDRLAGIFVGTPTRAGTWKLRVEVVDALKVKSTATIVLVIRA